MNDGHQLFGRSDMPGPTGRDDDRGRASMTLDGWCALAVAEYGQDAAVVVGFADGGPPMFDVVAQWGC